MSVDRFISVEEAKQQLCLGTTAIYEFINAGELRRVKLGRKTVFLASDIQAFIDRKVAEADALVCA
jgi:excisionase family DNA binding protein